MFAAFAIHYEVKRMAVMNPGVNIFASVDVEWPIATRMQAASDIFIVA